MIWIIGGTSEAREILERIKDLNNFIITIATVDGKEFFDTDNLKVGRMTYGEMEDFALYNNISLIVDLSHPFAKIVSDNAKKLAKSLDIDYIRYTRSKSNISRRGLIFSDYEEAYEYIKDIDGSVFFTSGSKNIKDFEKVRGSNRFIYRILPALESLEICKANNISMKDIVAVLGPFSKEFNIAMLREYKPKYCVMKDSGDEGGTNEKIQACEDLGIIPLIISREDEEGIRNLDEIEKIIRREEK